MVRAKYVLFITVLTFLKIIILVCNMNNRHEDNFLKARKLMKTVQFWAELPRVGKGAQKMGKSSIRTLL